MRVCVGGLTQRPYGTGSTLWHPLWHTPSRASRVCLHTVYQQTYGGTAIMMIVIKGKFVIGVRKQVNINVLTLAS